MNRKQRPGVFRFSEDCRKWENSQCLCVFGMDAVVPDDIDRTVGLISAVVAEFHLPLRALNGNGTDRVTCALSRTSFMRVVGATSAVGERGTALDRRQPATAGGAIDARESVHRPPRRPKPQAEPREILDIVRCDPRTYPRKQLEITAYVQDVHMHWPLSRRSTAEGISTNVTPCRPPCISKQRSSAT